MPRVGACKVEGIKGEKRGTSVMLLTIILKNNNKPWVSLKINKK